MFEDLLRRYLKFSGLKVTQVMNLTDVDDKTIRGAMQAGISLKEYTKKYEDAFFEDLAVLGIERAEHYPCATDHVGEMLAIIERLFDSGHAYKSDDGSVYFNVSGFAEYGRLSGLDLEGMRPGARVSQDEYDKENVADFALWKAWDAGDGDVVWDSPWGRGRPGWHIECTAMSMKYLGETFDIHTGGVDNMFPHHENEIAQSEGATGKPFVRYWMHCGYLVVNGTKMSKSLGNFYTLRDLLEKGYAGRELRYVLLSAQYRQQLNFTFEACDAARASLARLDEFIGRLREKGGDAERNGLPSWAKNAHERFKAALDEDLNTPEALGSLFDMVHAGNKAMDSGDVSDVEAAGVLAMLADLDRVLGILESGAETELTCEIESLLEARRQARLDKKWGESDEIRQKIADLGWGVRDTADGQKVKRVRT